MLCFVGGERVLLFGRWRILLSIIHAPTPRLLFLIMKVSCNVASCLKSCTHRQGSYLLVVRPKTSGIPEIMGFGRILMFAWSVGPLVPAELFFPDPQPAAAQLKQPRPEAGLGARSVLWVLQGSQVAHAENVIEEAHKT